ncbi:hypothetical protein E4T44_08498 [Aureobasidium sp. EXF-8845]|nr:hypothetical protein E4T44_08498 [Aureobasidium sp. EXF-8845]KAI4843818.1 hypothetical protein E4T45_08432 [Aureobasidium sp. EXF-8846]
MDLIYEKIAGKGPARTYNLQRCRKELEKSCSDYQNRGNRFPPTPRSTPCTNNATAQQQQQQSSVKQETKARFRHGHTLNETAHGSHKVKRRTFQYNEKEIRERAHQIRIQSRPRLTQPPVSTPDVCHSRTGHDSPSDDHNDDPNSKGFVPRRHPTLHRQNLTHEELVAIRDTAVRIADSCAVRDEKPHPDLSAQETLHRIRSAVWLEKTKRDCNEGAESPSPDQEEDDNGISVTNDGCIIQRGFDISPMASSPVDTVYSRCDSGIGVSARTPDRVSAPQVSCQETYRSRARNRKGARVPVCFRKQDIVHQQKVSHLSALFPGRDPSTVQTEDPKTTRNNIHQAQLPVLTRPLVFFSGSSSSGAVVSDSEDDSDEEQEEHSAANTEGVTIPTVCADGAKDMTSIGHGSIDTPVVMDKPAEIVKTSNRLPQRSVPPSPLPSKLPVPSPPRVEQVPPLHAGTPLPSQLSKHPNLTPGPRGQPPGRFPPPQQRHPRPQFVRSQQTTRVFLVHQQYRRAPKPLPPRAESPCQELGVRFIATPYESDNHVSALLGKTEKKGGRRPANFSWDHVAPMYGFSSCNAFYVLD